MRCQHEVAVGALVVNALEPDEQLHMQRHLAGCPRCTGTLRELADLPRALARVVPDDQSVAPPPPPAPSEVAFQRLRHEAAVQPRRRIHRCLLIAAAVLVLVASGVAVGLQAAEQPVPASTVSAADGNVQARAVLTPTEFGTRITMVLNGVRPGEQCQLIAVGRDGQEEIASTWTATYEGAASVTGSVGLQPRELDHLVIRTLDGRTLLTLAALLPE